MKQSNVQVMEMIDQIDDIGTQLEKAAVIVGELCQDYFGLRPENVDGKMLVQKYHCAGVLSDIVCDYIQETRRLVTTLEKRLLGERNGNLEIPAQCAQK